MNEQQIKLTYFSYGGGCGCKIAPRVLAEISSGVLCRVRRAHHGACDAPYTIRPKGAGMKPISI